MTRVDPQHRRGALAALVTAGLLWGLTVPLSKVALEWLDPAWLAFARFGSAAPVLLLVARHAVRASASGPVVLWGVVGFGAVVLLQNAGIARTSVTHAALIVGAVPALVAAVAIVRGRSTTGPLARAGFAVALGGVALVAGSGGEASLAGDGLMLASAFLGALFIDAQSRLLVGRDPVAVTAVQMGAAALVLLPVALAFEPLPVSAPAGGAALAALALVTFGSLLPFALYAKAQSRVPAEFAGAFVNVEPLVGAAIGALVFQDPFGAGQALGAAAIVGGILLSVAPPRVRRRGRPCLA